MTIYLWRVLCVFACLNLINIIVVDGGAGMEPVWMAIILGSFILSFKKGYGFFFGMKWFKWCVIIGLCLFLTIEVLIIGSGMGINIPSESDYLIVLGARVRGETPSLALQSRLDVALDYLSENKSTIAILSGGQGEGEDISEAEAMKRYLVSKGISEQRLILEDQSRDTDENIVNSFNIIEAQKEKAEVIVVTSRFHVLRSKIIARELGKEVKGLGSKVLPFLIPTYYLREFFAVVAEVIF